MRKPCQNPKCAKVGMSIPSHRWLASFLRFRDLFEALHTFRKKQWRFAMDAQNIKLPSLRLWTLGLAHFCNSEPRHDLQPTDIWGDYWCCVRRQSDWPPELGFSPPECTNNFDKQGLAECCKSYICVFEPRKDQAKKLDLLLATTERSNALWRVHDNEPQTLAVSTSHRNSSSD